MIDAGSTGTRLHLFEFSHDITKKHSSFNLETEIYKEVHFTLKKIKFISNVFIFYIIKLYKKLNLSIY